MRRNPVIMMCYKDRTWCSQSRDCGNITCDRNFTEEEREKAIKWWGEASFPIAMTDFKTNDCGWRAKTSLTCCKSASGENKELIDET